MISLLLLIGWVSVEPIRVVPGNDIVADVQSHLPKNNDYRDKDKITTVHESTHGINNRLRGKYKKPSFYVLNNRAYIFDKESKGTLKEVAKRIPENLRGSVYNLYLIKSQRYWNNQPSYLFDEFTAYTNGSLAREQLKILDRQETVEQMLQLAVYSYYVNDNKIFWKWQTKKALAIYKRSGLRFDYAEKPEFKKIISELDREYIFF